METYRDAPRAADEHGRNNPQPPANDGHGASAAFSFGTIFIVFGVLGVLWQTGNHAACNSIIVQAASPTACQEANTIWTIGIAGVIVGAALLVVGAILRSGERR